MHWSYALCPGCRATDRRWKSKKRTDEGNTECVDCGEKFHDADDGMWLFSNNQDTFWEKYFVTIR